MPDPFVLVPAGTLARAGTGDHVALPASTVRHLLRVRRLGEGAMVVVADGSGAVAAGRVIGEQLVLDDEPVTTAAPMPRVHVWQAVGKGRKHDEVVRVLTELGVDAITAVVSGRTVVDLAGKGERVRARWEAVARAACEQARRGRVPDLHGPSALADLLAGLDGRACLSAHVGDGGVDPLAGAQAAEGAGEVVVAVGPEGGWSDPEVAAFRAAGATMVGLGPTVLRTEHAATVLASIVLAAAGRMHP